MLNKKIIFVTSTRADFGKLKSLIKITKKNRFEVFIVVTGMHMLQQFGMTYKEVIKNFKSRIIKFTNQKKNEKLEIILSKTINNFSAIVKKVKPDMIVIHGDRVEALSCALVGSLNHILTAHIEGGEISGTIDDSIRHSITKLSHVHFVGSNKAFKRVYRMGEPKKNIFKIGSPDLDIILNKKLPSISDTKKRYSIEFKDYCILLWHPVTSEIKDLRYNTTKIINFLKKLNLNVIIIFPNNDPGYEKIIKCYNKIKNSKKFKILKSLRFENYLSLLKNSKFIIGNSSSAIYEAPIFNIPAINLGTRQKNRHTSKLIKNLKINELTEKNVKLFLKKKVIIKKESNYGTGKSDSKFINIIRNKSFWKIETQKYFSENSK